MLRRTFGDVNGYKIRNLKELREACFYLIEMAVKGNVDYSIAINVNHTCNLLAAVLECHNILQMDASQMRVVRIACENLTEVIAKGDPSHVDFVSNGLSMKIFLYEVLKKISIGNADALNELAPVSRIP